MAPEQTGPQMSVIIQSAASESGTKTYDRSTEQESGQTSIFDNVEAIAYKQWEEEERNVKEKIESVIQEIQLLLLENKFQTEERRRVLGQEDLLPVISHKKFLKEFADWQMGKVDNTYFIFVFSVWNLRREERRQEEQRQEQQERWEETHEVLWENIEQFKTQEQQWMQELLEENPEAVENIKQQVQQMLEQGTISQTSYDEFMERYGLDEIDSGENEEEEEDHDRDY